MTLSTSKHLLKCHYYDVAVSRNLAFKLIATIQSVIHHIISY